MSKPPAEPSRLDEVQERPGGRSERVRTAVLTAAREELLDGGWDSFSHRATAKRAGVDPATVYRRWPTRPRLAIDALVEVAGKAAPLPDTGSLSSDLREFLLSVHALLREPRFLRLLHAFSVAAATDDEELREMVRSFWDARYEHSTAMIHRGAERGEIAAGVDAERILEQLVGPLYFRVLVTAQELDEDQIDGAIEAVLKEAREGRPPLKQ